MDAQKINTDISNRLAQTVGQQAIEIIRLQATVEALQGELATVNHELQEALENLKTLEQGEGPLFDSRVK